LQKQVFLSAIALLAYSYFFFLLSILGMKKDAHLLNAFNKIVDIEIWD